MRKRTKGDEGGSVLDYSFCVLVLLITPATKIKPVALLVLFLRDSFRDNTCLDNVVELNDQLLLPAVGNHLLSKHRAKKRKVSGPVAI